MSDSVTLPPLQDVGGEGKKRKRTGKDRKQAKILAEQAEERMKAIIEAAKNESHVHMVKPSPVKQEKPIQAGQAGPGAIEAERVKAEKEAAAAAKREPESIAKRIPQGLKAIHPLLKQARTFETQRLIKKIKWSRTKGEDVTDMEVQISTLTNLNLHDLASAYLCTKISKHHLFKHFALPAPILSALSTAEPQSTSADAAQRFKAKNRLVSNKAVADGIKDILAWVMGDEGARLMGKGQVQGMKGRSQREVKVEKGKRGDPSVQMEEDDDEEDEEDEDTLFREQVITSPHRQLDDGAGEDDENEEADEEGAAADAAGWESGSVDDIDDGESDDEDGEDGEDSNSDGEEEVDSGAETDNSDAIPIPKRARPIPTTKPNKKASISTPTVLPRVKSIIAPISKPDKPAKATKTKPAKPEKPLRKEDITSSLFLPSLASGFTRGDSDDSDPDLDVGDDGLIGKKGAERKNRRGQRARQAIWEKKYGKNAKHVVKSREADNAQQAQTNIRNAYGNRAGPTANTNTSSSALVGKQPFGNAARPTPTPSTARFTAPGPAVSSPAQPKVPSAAPSSGSAGLHPSWEAARKKKQMLAAAPAAQKIVFD